jgi:hypothetical protein
LLDIRSPLIAWAAPAGLAVAAVAWFAGHGLFYQRDVSDLEARASAGRRAPRMAVVMDTTGAVERISAAPLFALTSGPGAVTDPPIELQGLAITPGGRSALLAISGKPAEWYELGQTRDGITVMEIKPTAVTVDTAIGFKEIGLSLKMGAASSKSSAATSHQSPSGAGAGFRAPPEPASAPVVVR